MAIKIDKKALKLPAQAPLFTLKDINGIVTSLKQTLNNSPAIIVFYRGGWCPFCHIQLKYYQDSINLFNKSGAQLIAISSEKPSHAAKTADKHQLSFPLLFDHGAEVAKAFSVAFRNPKATEERHEMVNVPLDEWNDDSGKYLPIPGAFAIDTSGIIQHTFAKGHYRYRA